MRIRNTHSNVYLFDVDDQMDDNPMQQLSISCVDENIFISVSERQETADTVTYKMVSQLGFDIKTFVAALNTAFNGSNYDIMLEVTPKHEPITVPQNIIDALEKLRAIEFEKFEVSAEDADIFEA
jgi:hypothetical protein